MVVVFSYDLQALVQNVYSEALSEIVKLLVWCIEMKSDNLQRNHNT